MNKQPERRYYTFLTPQPITVRCIFNALVLVDCLHGVPECSGNVQAWITVAGRVSGPFETGIQTQTSIWEGRHHARPSLESDELTTEVRQYVSRVEAVWADLVQAGHTVTGEMIYQQLTAQVVPL